MIWKDCDDLEIYHTYSGLLQDSNLKSLCACSTLCNSLFAAELHIWSMVSTFSCKKLSYFVSWIKILQHFGCKHGQRWTSQMIVSWKVNKCTFHSLLLFSLIFPFSGFWNTLSMPSPGLPHLKRSRVSKQLEQISTGRMFQKSHLFFSQDFSLCTWDIRPNFVLLYSIY